MLDGADAHMILDSIEGEARIGTGPVRNAYVALCHTDLNKSLNALNGFESRWNYANPTASPMKSERGAVINVRFFTSSVATVRPNASRLGKNVYDIYVQGMESVGVIGQDNFSSQLLYRGPEFSDALFQNVTYGWTSAQVSAVLNDQWLSNMQATL